MQISAALGHAGTVMMLQQMSNGSYSRGAIDVKEALQDGKVITEYNGMDAVLDLRNSGALLSRMTEEDASKLSAAKSGIILQETKIEIAKK